MHSLLFTWPYDGVFTGVVLLTVVPERRIKRQSRLTPRTQDVGSSRLLTVVAVTGVLAAFALGLAVPAADMRAPRMLFWCGLAAIVAARLLRLHAFRMLGESFTLVIHAAPGQPLVERGAYGRIRHPAYAAAGLAFIGVGMVFANWLSLGLLLGAWAVAYTYRVRVEERVLIAAMGDPYRAYMKRTKRFIPFIV